MQGNPVIFFHKFYARLLFQFKMVRINNTPLFWSGASNFKASFFLFNISPKEFVRWQELEWNSGIFGIDSSDVDGQTNVEKRIILFHLFFGSNMTEWFKLNQTLIYFNVMWEYLNKWFPTGVPSSNSLIVIPIWPSRVAANPKKVGKHWSIPISKVSFNLACNPVVSLVGLNLN